MENPGIYISENAFLILTLSAVETSVTNECAGLLFGYRTDEKFYVELAIPFQLVRRTAGDVFIHPRKKARLYRVIDRYLKYEIIGEFHSHPKGDPWPSKEDVNYIFRSAYPIEIVIGIREKKDFQPWKIEGHFLSGSLDRYFIEMAGFTEVGRGRGKKVMLINIECPYALGFEADRKLPELKIKEGRK